MNLWVQESQRKGIIFLKTSKIIEFVLVFVLFERLLIQIGISDSIIYILDAINIILFVLVVNKRVWNQFPGIVLPYIILIFFSTAMAIANYIIWGGTPLYTLIELRNIIRFPVFFIACVAFLNGESCKRIYKILIVFFYVNIFFIFYQYITFHPTGVWTRGDYLNGLFGTTVGGNTFVNVIFIVVVTYMVVQWSNREISLKFFIPAILSSLAISGLIELKAFFLEFVMLYAWYLLKKKKSPKERNINIAVIAMILIVTYVSLQIMYREYPWFRDTMTLQGMINLLTGNGYTGLGDLNRFTGVFTISSEFFKNNFFDILFGIGLGNGSAFSIGERLTRFYTLYQSSHYNWFSATYIFVQSGAFGLSLYLYTFVYLFRKKKKSKLGINSQIMCIMALFLTFYGEALKTDAGYFVYFAIASGFIYIKNKEEENSLKEKSKI